MKNTLSIVALLAAVPALAEEKRELDAHVHGVGVLNIAAEGSDVLMELEVPGADIVGFEYAAKTDADRKAVDAAVATLATPLDLFVLPAAAGCSVTEARAALEMEDEHAEHGHDDHARRRCPADCDRRTAFLPRRARKRSFGRDQRQYR